MKQYNVTGMSCAACQARVEKAVSAIPGVESCAVSLLTNSMGVEGNISDEEIISAVVKAGYGASIKGGNSKTDSSKSGDTKANNGVGDPEEDFLKDLETPLLIKRLVASLIFLIPLMYVSMGHMMWGWPVIDILDDNPLAVGIYELILSIVVMIINQKFFTSGIKGLIHKSPNMDTLVALGSSASFGYSLISLFAMSDACVKGSLKLAQSYLDGFYFESAAMILTLITVGKVLEAKSKGRTTDALKGLMKLAPKVANVVIDGEAVEVPIDQVVVGTRFVVKSGDKVPVDGVVVSGNASINEATLTGESIPVDKSLGDRVSAATISQSGYIECEALRVGENTTYSQIIQMVSDAAATKAPIAKIADRVSGVFVPVVLGIAFVTFVIWMITGQTVGFSLSRAISVLVISCPCALGLATPVAIMVGNGVAAKNGIMFKTASALENAGKVNVIALDKTGTITKGEPKVKEVIAFNTIGIEDETKRVERLLELAFSLEAKSEHPLSKAITQYAKELGIECVPICDFETVPGKGVSAVIGKQRIFVGNLKYISEVSLADVGQGTGIDDLVDITKDKTVLDEFVQKGYTSIYVATKDDMLGVIAIADEIKEDSPQAIEELKDMGIHVVMLTGDNVKTAKTIGELAGVDEIIADVLPDGKEEAIRKLQEGNIHVAMVGDGINDAPALTRADVGIAIGAGTDIAIDAADVVLMKNSLLDVAAAIRISRATLKNIKENLFWAFIYNVIGIPLAAGLWIPIVGWSLKPMFGAAAMSLSSFCVVTNALRLNLIKVYKSRNNNINMEKNSIGLESNDSKVIIKEENKMEITVNGMMCAHCEAHTKKALEAVDGVVRATPDHNTNSVLLEVNGNVNEAELKKAVEDAGYEFGGLK